MTSQFHTEHAQPSGKLQLRPDYYRIW